MVGMTQNAAPLGDYAVVTDSLTKRFGRRTVVDHVSFSVPNGAVAGLVGPNGAGKTTIMGMLLGLVTPSEGEAWVLGRPIAARAEYLPRVGSLIEAPALHPGVTAIDNLRALAMLSGHSASEIEDLIDLVGLTGRGGDRYGTYSLGMKQRLGIAAALLGQPELVILDEPTNGLDPMGMQDVRRIIGEIAQRGRTVIVSSHLLAELEAVCDWLVVVDRGGLVHSGPMSALGGDVDDVLVIGAGVERSDDLADVVTGLGRSVDRHDPEQGSLRVRITDGDEPRTVAAEINAAAHRAGIVVHELHHVQADLEARYLNLVTTGGRP
jgi:ABC-2 type transport system ATP-binding protein